MQDIIDLALMKIAHAIDSRFDEQQDYIERLEKRHMMLKRNFRMRLNSAIQIRQAQMEETLHIFRECVETVRIEV